jgi:hypothetical protein
LTKNADKNICGNIFAQKSLILQEKDPPVIFNLASFFFN